MATGNFAQKVESKSRERSVIMLFLGKRLVCQLCTRKVELTGGQDGGQCFDVDVNGCDKIEELF
jgi:hypothetical protein